MEFLQQLQPVLTVLQWVVVIGAAIFMLFMRSIFATKAEVTAVDTAAKADAAALQARVTALELANRLLAEQLGNSPTSKELHALQIAMTALTGKLEVHNERMEGLEDLQKVIKRQVDVMDDYLRDRK